MEASGAGRRRRNDERFFNCSLCLTPAPQTCSTWAAIALGGALESGAKAMPIVRLQVVGWQTFSPKAHFARAPRPHTELKGASTLLRACGAQTWWKLDGELWMGHSWRKWLFSRCRRARDDDDLLAAGPHASPQFGHFMSALHRISFWANLIHQLMIVVASDLSRLLAPLVGRSHRVGEARRS